MEERKIDPYQFIGFILIALIMTWMLMNQQPVDETQATSPETTNTTQPQNSVASDVQTQRQQQVNFGTFTELAQPREVEEYVIENQSIALHFSTKGGQMTKAHLKAYTNYRDESLFLVDDNQQINFTFTTRDGRTLNTADLYFIPVVEKSNTSEVITLKAALNESQWIGFRYELPSNDLMVDFTILSQGMESVINPTIPQRFRWDLKAFRNSRSVEYENRYTELTFGYEDEKVDELSISGEDNETVDDVQWIGFKQHFFNSILIPNADLNEVELESKSLVESEDKNQRYTKNYVAVFPLQSQGELLHRFKWYFGPSEYKTLAKYDLGIEKIINFGWGIFGWINKSIFIPLFDFLSSFLPFGIAIIIMTIIVRLAMSPVTYRSYVSQIKMKVLKPEVDEINKKHEKDAVKRQQETMALYNKAGANPMSGCLPALLQLPVFYALFSFFPVAFALREKSFLWADDLSSYDSVYSLPFSIPFYGDHISLFPILASVAIFIYTMMTMGQQQATQQPGMPNMKFIMYLMPLMMLFFFNNYASGLSLYYFVSNLLTILLMLVIKNFVISEEKIFAQIEANKKKPKKAGGFTARLQKAMEEAEKQQKAKQRRNR